MLKAIANGVQNRRAMRRIALKLMTSVLRVQQTYPRDLARAKKLALGAEQRGFDGPSRATFQSG